MFVSPEKVIEILDVIPGMTIADFGCGSGHYVFGSAKRLGKSGKVYAIDIQKEMLSFVRSQAQQLGLSNVETIWTDLETDEATHLKNESVDLVLISNILFQAENKNQIIKEAYRILRSGGRVAAIEWDVENRPASPASQGGPNAFGPSMASRISPQTAKDFFTAAGFSFEREFNPGDHHYGLIFKKS